MRKKISYFSYDGILEPLGNSQVLNYLILLSKKYKISLFTFEKLKDINDKCRLIEMKNLCDEHSITWRYSIFNEGLFSSKLNPFKYSFFIFRNYFNLSNIIHARSFIPSYVAYIISKIKFNTKYIYDMRGYWIDEKVDVGKISRKSLIYKFLKWFDCKIIINANHIVTLSNVSKKYLKENYGKETGCITTIYTCTDLNKFTIQTNNNDDICFGYVGTTIGWYQFEETLDFIKLAFNNFPNSKFKIITRDNKEELLNRIIRKNIDLSKILITSSNFDKIQEEYKDIDFAVFFIKNSFSKTASMPTKFGEFLASGIPCIVNSKIGDMSEIILNNPTSGFVIDDFNENEYKNIIYQLKAKVVKDEPFSCRKIAETYFSLERGALSYSNIYETL